MNNYPEFAQTKNKKYKINTDFKIALKCNIVATNADINDEERALAIIYLLFGDEGLDNPNDWEELIKIALKFLSCGKTTQKENNKEEVNMDFEQDWSYISASFFSDYKVDISKENMHWWRFYELVCGLSEKCVFNRVRFVRDFDTSKIKDSKERKKWEKQKQELSLKRKKTSKERRLDELFEKQLKGE